MCRIAGSHQREGSEKMAKRYRFSVAYPGYYTGHHYIRGALPAWRVFLLGKRAGAKITPVQIVLTNEAPE